MNELTNNFFNIFVLILILLIMEYDDIIPFKKEN